MVNWWRPGTLSRRLLLLGASVGTGVAVAARIYFTITPSGEEYLDKLMEEYHSFTGAVDHVLSQTDVLRGK